MPPTSRPPMALGWPVSENGPAPGLPICPVARCRLISAVFLAVPLLDWFSPWQYRLSVGARPGLYRPLEVAVAAGLTACSTEPTPTPTPESGAIPANHCAACVSAVLVMPQTCVTTSGVQSRTKALRASKPLVWAAMKAWSTQPSHNMMCSMPLNSITSVPGRIGRYRSATSALSVRRGSATMSFRFGLAWRASSMRRNSTGCA